MLSVLPTIIPLTTISETVSIPSNSSIIFVSDFNSDGTAQIYDLYYLKQLIHNFKYYYRHNNKLFRVSVSIHITLSYFNFLL